MIFSHTIGIVEVNGVKCPLHCVINTLNHLLHIGYHWLSRLYTPDGHLPPRGKGRTDLENKAIMDGKKQFKNEISNGPAKIRADRPDATGR